MLQLKLEFLSLGFGVFRSNLGLLELRALDFGVL